MRLLLGSAATDFEFFEVGTFAINVMLTASMIPRTGVGVPDFRPFEVMSREAV